MLTFIVSPNVASIRGQLLLILFLRLVQLLFEGGFYLRAASIQENTVMECLKALGRNESIRKFLKNNMKKWSVALTCSSESL